MILYPNAKINIGLKIESKRNDGYHNISSVFYPLKGSYDILEITKSPVFLFSCSGIKIPKGENLCEKAFTLIDSKFSISPVHIHLHKRIPIGAGLGGGSSDASFTLKGLNQLGISILITGSDNKIDLEIRFDMIFIERIVKSYKFTHYKEIFYPTFD